MQFRYDYVNRVPLITVDDYGYFYANGCAYCGTPAGFHGNTYRCVQLGNSTALYVQPSQAIIKERMKANKAKKDGKKKVFKNI